MIMDKKEKLRQYYKLYREKNKEKLRQHSKLNYQKNKQYYKEYGKKWEIKNKEKRRIWIEYMKKIIRYVFKDMPNIVSNLNTADITTLK